MLKLKKDAQYYPLFDWLRGFLGIIVMVSHEGLIGWE